MSTHIPTPRTTNGQKLHRIGDDVYAVLVDLFGEEVGERHPGQLWVAFEPMGQFHALFVDEAAFGDMVSTFVKPRGARGGQVRCGIVVDGELTLYEDGGRTWHLDPGGALELDRTVQWRLMA